MPFSGISVGWGWADRNDAARNKVVRYTDRPMTLTDEEAFRGLEAPPGAPRNSALPTPTTPRSTK